MSGLVRRAGALVRRAGSDVAVPVRTAASTERVAFVGELITWADLPAETRRGAQRRAVMLAESVEPDPRVWQDASHPFQLATGWRFHEDAVVVAQVRRPLEPRAGGDYRPTGPWQHMGVRSRTFAGPLRRRRGLVQVANELTDKPPEHVPVGSATHASAAEAWTFLPAAVREAVERLVPEPDVWLGQITQRSIAEVPFAQSIQVLRMSDTRAVLIAADRSLPTKVVGSPDERRAQLSRSPWVVDQAGGELDETVTRLGAE